MKELIKKWRDSAKALKAYGINTPQRLFTIANIEFDRFGRPTNLAELELVSESQRLGFELAKITEAAKYGVKLPVPAEMFDTDIRDKDGSSVLCVKPEVPLFDFETAPSPLKIGALKNELFKCCSTDRFRPNLTGVYHSNGERVATDAHILVLLRNQKYDEAFEGHIINDKGFIVENAGKFVNYNAGKFVNYNAVIPTGGERYALDLRKLAAELNGIILTSQNAGAPKQQHRVNCLGKAFNAELMLQVVKALLEAGETKADYIETSPNKAAVIECESGSLGLVMPLILTDGDVKHFKGFTILH